jgi:hypothetical protein
MKTEKTIQNDDDDDTREMRKLLTHLIWFLINKAMSDF